MKNKLNLSDFKVKSFVTSLEGHQEVTVKGGENKKSESGCLTVVTFGIWSYCCQDETGGNVC